MRLIRLQGDDHVSFEFTQHAVSGLNHVSFQTASNSEHKCLWSPDGGRRGGNQDRQKEKQQSFPSADHFLDCFLPALHRAQQAQSTPTVSDR